MCDKYICTKSPDSWMRATTTHPLERCVNARLAEMVVHTCNSYCGRYALGAIEIVKGLGANNVLTETF